jgi:hypothetical protein
MQSLSFRPGRAFLSSNSSAVPWTVVFEDEGVAAYFYACDRSQQTQEASILNAMLIYNVGSLQDAETERLAAIEWSKDGQRAVLYLDGTAQALFDFAARAGHCRLDFPNFLAGQNDAWRKDSHAWSEAALQRFEAELYG